MLAWCDKLQSVVGVAAAQMAAKCVLGLVPQEHELQDIAKSALDVYVSSD